MVNRDIYWRRYKIHKTLYIGQRCLSPLQSYSLLEETWFTGSGLNQVISNCSMMFLLLCDQKLRNKFCNGMFHAKICVKISDTVVFGVPRSAGSSRAVSHRSLLIVAHTPSTLTGVLLAAGLPERGSLSADSQPSLKRVCHTFICAALIASSPKVFWIIRVVSTEGCSSLTWNSTQIHCSACLVILNVAATQYTCPLNGIYHPHWLVQWSRHCSHMLILVHSLWLPGYITVSQTALILLTMTWFFPDRPHIYINQREDKIVYNQILNYLVK